MALKKGRFESEENPNWKGERLVASNGHMLVRLPNRPLADVISGHNARRSQDVR